MLGYHAARAALEWQVEMGATEAIGDAPVNRYTVTDRATAAPAIAVSAVAAPAVAAPAGSPMPAPEAVADALAEARAAAAAAGDLAALAEAIAAYPHCDLRRGARSTVFADGTPGARVMVIGEAPGREEDIAGLPFVGRAGQMLDRMFAAIGLSRRGEGEAALYITNMLPWRPPQNRDPTPGEIAMMRPFVERHVALAAPQVLVLMGNIPCQGLLERRGITRMRGQWTEALGLPVLPMFHPAFLLRQPQNKRAAWEDLLSLKERLG